jgi:nicotinamide-nucleotide amidase
LPEFHGDPAWSKAMTNSTTVDIQCAQRIAKLLKASGQTLAVSESSAGGLISATLLSVPGASSYFMGGGVLYTGTAYKALFGLDPAAFKGLRSATDRMARLLALTAQTKLGATWGLAETGAAGPGGNRYGDPAGHCCIAVSGLREASRVFQTGSADRMANMVAFANAALALFEETIGRQ